MASPAAGGSAEGAATFAYTDGRGESVKLDAIPRRIVASEQAAAALIPYGIVPVGVWGQGAPADSIPLRGLDVAAMQSVGQSYGEVSLEQIAALKPDLIITGLYPGGFLGGLGAGDSPLAQSLDDIAPVIAVSAEVPSSEALVEYSDLAALMGADIDSPTILAQRSAYEQAVADFKAATASKPGLKAMAIAPADQFYVSIVQEFPELRDYRDWGLGLLESSVQRSTTSGSFSPVGWENATDLDPDLTLLDHRPTASSPDKIQAEHPTWQLIRAVKNGALTDWTTDAANNYQSYTAQILTLTKAIESTSIG